MDSEAMDVVESQSAVLLPGVQPAANTAEHSTSAPSNGTGSTFAAWNTPKHREEVDSYQTRLVDQGFSISDFGDPLTANRPLAQIYSREFPEKFEASLRESVESLQSRH
ncbi:hypothetical protein SEPCBS119000_004218 [Sporothrix epigloea]|uniref:Uncharacterized protein n=1 Tax=Sporothrix epigloea TaxID=1892477 RepID=A0ABP0DQW5_9PEZI